jgi:hypothetical protein
MSFSDDMQDLFDPVIADIIKLVEQQLEEAKKNSGARIDVSPFQTTGIAS